MGISMWYLWIFLVILVGYLLTKAKDCDLSKKNRGTYDLTNKKGDLSNT